MAYDMSNKKENAFKLISNKQQCTWKILIRDFNVGLRFNL